jgi:hypothetical protein
VQPQRDPKTKPAENDRSRWQFTPNLHCSVPLSQWVSDQSVIPELKTETTRIEWLQCG